MTDRSGAVQPQLADRRERAAIPPSAIRHRTNPWSEGYAVKNCPDRVGPTHQAGRRRQFDQQRSLEVSSGVELSLFVARRRGSGLASSHARCQGR